MADAGVVGGAADGGGAAAGPALLPGQGGAQVPPGDQAAVGPGGEDVAERDAAPLLQAADARAALRALGAERAAAALETLSLRQIKGLLRRGMGVDPSLAHDFRDTVHGDMVRLALREAGLGAAAVQELPAGRRAARVQQQRQLPLPAVQAVDVDAVAGELRPFVQRMVSPLRGQQRPGGAADAVPHVVAGGRARGAQVREPQPVIALANDALLPSDDSDADDDPAEFPGAARHVAFESPQARHPAYPHAERRGAYVATSFADNWLARVLGVEAAGSPTPSLEAYFRDRVTRTWDTRHAHSVREIERLARIVDSLRGQDVDEALDVACRRIAGIWLAVDNGNWDLCDRLERRTQSAIHSLPPDEMQGLARAVKMAQHVRQAHGYGRQRGLGAGTPGDGAQDEETSRRGGRGRGRGGQAGGQSSSRSASASGARSAPAGGGAAGPAQT